MTQVPVRPEKVHKPIQLLAAWLAGLVIIDSCFLAAAVNLEPGTTERLILVVASVGNVPALLVALFLLQTRFRPELQEDLFYSKYLDRKTNAVVQVSQEQAIVSRVREAVETELRTLPGRSEEPEVVPGPPVAHLTVALNRRLSDFAELRSQLKREKIPLASIFGTENPPTLRMVAISEDVPFSLQLETLRLAMRLKFEAYVHYDRFLEDSSEHILLGSYGSEGFLITPDLAKVLDEDPEPVDLELYEQNPSLRTQKSNIEKPQPTTAV